MAHGGTSGRADPRAGRPVTSDAAECERRIAEIYGAPGTGGASVLDGDLRAGGTIHVTAAGRDEHGGLHAIAIGPGSPPSDTDSFLLGVARARAEAIVTTAATLRAEPGTHHGPQGRPDDALLAAWRREVAGLSGPPLSIVLTRGGDVPSDHPMLAGFTPVLLVTGPAGARVLRARPVRPGIEVLELPEPSLRAAIDQLHRRGCRTICVESGPSTARDLHRAPVALDELMLSTWEGGILPPSLRAGDLPDEREIERTLPRSSAPAWRDERSGRWRFVRRRRR